MKSWMLRLGALAVVSGLGCFGVMIAQHRWATQDAPPPDWSQPPVNAEAVAAMNGEHAAGDRYVHPVDAGAPEVAAAPTRPTEIPAASADRPPVDPFQGISQTSLGSNYRNSSADDRNATDSNADKHSAAERVVPAGYEQNAPPDGDSAGANNSVGRNPFRTGNTGDRTAETEPRRLEADPSAAPLTSDPSMSRNALRGGVPAAAEAGADAGQSTRSIPDAANDLHVDNGARKVSGIAAATGSVEAVNDAAQNGAAAIGNRYGGPSAMPNGAGDYRQQSSAGDLRSLSDSQIPNEARSLSSARNIDSADAALARGMPGGPSTSSGSLSAGNLPNGIADRGMPASVPMNNLASVGSLPMGTGFPSATGGTVDPTASSVNTEGFGKPGDKKLEGAQTPSVTIEKVAPPEIQVGKEATFQIVVRNTGPVLADDVQVTDAVPQGTRLVNTTPKTSLGPRGEIVWKVGDMKPGEESKLQVHVMPLEEGEIGSTAVVQFRSAASVRTVATKPELVLEVNAPQQAMIGSDVKMQIKLSNPGTGVASKVVLSAKVPPNFQHPAGNELEFEVGEFRPGETRDLDLTLHAVQAGAGAITLAAQGDASLHVEKAANIEVVAPRLEVKLAGPAMRYLDRQAKYTVSVSNPGTAAARDITLTTHLPQGMQFVEASDSGQYNAGTNSVMWGLDELPPGQSGNVTLTALAKEAGDQKFHSEVKGAGGLTDGTDQMTVVEGVAAVNFTVAHLEDPVEVGGNATYEIHIVNQGSKAANRLQVVAVMPPEIKPVSGDGPSKQAIEGQKIAFEPLARLAPKADITYRVVGQCLSPGDLRVQVLLQTDDMAKPVIKEEGTRVYKD